MVVGGAPFEHRRDPLLLPAYQQHGADMMTARDIAHISMASTRHRRSAADYTRAAMERQHGVRLLDDGATAADLYAMERVPDQTTIYLRRRDAVLAERGSAFATCYVGGHKDLVTLAQTPPACGDAWSTHLCLKRGRYVLESKGWLNPAHGILDISHDGTQVGAGLDWCGARTAEHCSWSTRAATPYQGGAAVATLLAIGVRGSGSASRVFA